MNKTEQIFTEATSASRLMARAGVGWIRVARELERFAKRLRRGGEADPTALQQALAESTDLQVTAWEQIQRLRASIEHLSSM